MSLLRWLAAVSLLLGTVIAASFTTVDDDHDVLITNLLSWLRDNGAYINDAVVVRHVNQNDASTPRGLFATKTIEEGETIATIPWNLIIKSKDKTGEPGWSETDCGIIDATIEAMSGDNITPYGHYLLAQPRGYTPGFWGKEATELLEEMLNDRLPPNDVDDMLDSEWKKICRGNVNNPLHVHAVMLVRARSDWDLLVPFYDMANHHNGKTNIQHKYNPYVESIKETGHSLIASKRIEVGEELYNSYNHCKNVCDQYLDHFGTPEMFLHFGFVEFLPQRWLFDFARVKFDLVQGEEDKVSVNFLVPPSERGMAMLREELDRLESFASKRRGMDYKEANITETEWTLLWQYFDALRDALSFAIKSDEALVDDVWKLDDDWWVRDGTIKATDDEHWIRPTPRDGDEEL